MTKILTIKQPTKSEIKKLEITNILFRTYESGIENASEINMAYLSKLLSDKDITVDEYAELVESNNKMSLLY